MRYWEGIPPFEGGEAQKLWLPHLWRCSGSRWMGLGCYLV